MYLKLPLIFFCPTLSYLQVSVGVLVFSVFWFGFSVSAEFGPDNMDTLAALDWSPGHNLTLKFLRF